MLIYLMGKDVDVTNITSEGIKNSSLSLAVFNGNKKMNSVFIQTESLTNNMIGITEYGRMTFNSENTDLSAVIDVSADVDGEIVTKTLSVQSCLDTVEGTELGTGGGGGKEYTAGYGINIIDNEISVDDEVLATKEYVDEIVVTNNVSGDDLITYVTSKYITQITDFNSYTSSEQFRGGRKAFIKNNILTLNVSSSFAFKSTSAITAITIGVLKPEYWPKEDIATSGIFFAPTISADRFYPLLVTIWKDSGIIKLRFPKNEVETGYHLAFSCSYEINNVE